MENQKKNQTFPKKQNPANFFKDNITEKMKNYFCKIILHGANIEYVQITKFRCNL